MNNFIQDKRNVEKASDKIYKKFEDHFKFSRYKGVHYGLPLNVYMQKLFRFNEQALPQDKWTDVEICIKVTREYRKFENLLKSWQPENYEKKVMDLRHKFNRGILVASMPELPEKLSYRYDKHGRIICSRFAKKNFEESISEWILKTECRYSALAYYQMDQGVYSDDTERDWFQPEDHPYVKKEMGFILQKSKQAHDRHARGILRKKGNSETSVSQS
jgi:hypothetical protein